MKRKIIKASIPVILFLLFVVITVSINFTGVFPSTYSGDAGDISFGGNVYTRPSDSGTYVYDDAANTISLYSSSGTQTEWTRYSVYRLTDSLGNQYISAAAITLQVFAAICYIAGCAYTCIAYRQE